MYYKYRWIYAALTGLLLIMMGYIILIKPQIAQLDVLNQQEKKLTNNIYLIKQTIKQSPANYVTQDLQANKLNWLQDLIALAHINGLSIETIKTISLQTSEDVMTYLIVQGDFQQLISFLLAQRKYNFSAWVQDFVIKLTDQDQLQMSMTILPSIANLQTNDNKSSSINQAMHNPFCLPETIKENLRINDLSEVSLLHMKMVGYLHQGEDSEALVLLPNKRVIAIKLWNIIGKEHATVVSIQHDRIILKLSAGEQREITW